MSNLGIDAVTIILLFEEGYKENAYDIFINSISVQPMTFADFCVFLQAILDQNITKSA